LRGALHGAWGEDGGVKAEEAPLSEELVDGPFQLVPDAHHGAGAAVAEPEVAVVHEVVYAVLLGSDGVLHLGAAHHMKVPHGELKPPRGPPVLPHPAPHP